MSAALRSSAARIVRSGVAASRPAATRQMSGDAHSAAADMSQWRTISIGGGVVMVGFGGYMFYKLANHHSHFDRSKNEFPYMNIRAKQYPWSCDNCNLFDTKCWAECKASK